MINKTNILVIGLGIMAFGASITLGAVPSHAVLATGGEILLADLVVSDGLASVKSATVQPPTRRQPRRKKKKQPPATTPAPVDPVVPPVKPVKPVTPPTTPVKPAPAPTTPTCHYGRTAGTPITPVVAAVGDGFGALEGGGVPDPTCTITPPGTVRHNMTCEECSAACVAAGGTALNCAGMGAQ